MDDIITSRLSWLSTKFSDTNVEEVRDNRNFHEFRIFFFFFVSAFSYFSFFPLSAKRSFFFTHFLSSKTRGKRSDKGHRKQANDGQRNISLSRVDSCLAHRNGTDDFAKWIKDRERKRKRRDSKREREREYFAMPRSTMRRCLGGKPRSFSSFFSFPPPLTQPSLYPHAHSFSLSWFLPLSYSWRKRGRKSYARPCVQGIFRRETSSWKSYGGFVVFLAR